MLFHERHDQLVEEDPLVLEKAIKEVSEVVTWDHRGEETKDPLACIDICTDVIIAKSLVKDGQMSRDQKLNHQAVLEQARELRLIDVTHLAVLNECDEKPKSEGLRAVQEQLGDYKVHTLDVVDLSLIVRECNEHSSEFLVATPLYRLHKVMMAWECTSNITLNLSK